MRVLKPISMFIESQDNEVASALQQELVREREGLEMIASENIVSEAILETLGSPLVNKYSEGYYSKRYYGGNEYIDILEKLAIDRAKSVFGCEHVNVQPHSGSQANQAALLALAKPHDKILAMDLSHGGHLTHGSKVNFSGIIYDFVHYGVSKETERIDMNSVRELALKEKPKVIIAGFSAYPRHLDFATFRSIADEVGAYLMVDMAHFAGLVAAKLHPNPVPYADVVTLTTHKTLRGPRGGMILSCIQDRFAPVEPISPELAGTVVPKQKTLAQKIDSALFPGIQGGPLDQVIAAKAVALKEALQPSFVDYQKQVLTNAQVLSQALSSFGFRLITGGTDNHLVLIDATSRSLTGKQLETLLDFIGIYTNKNMIPFDTRSPFDPSGIRLGTPALTTRGMKEPEMKQIAAWIDEAITHKDNEPHLQSIRTQIKELTKQFPLYPNLKYTN